MAFLLSSERPGAAAMSNSFTALLANWFAKTRAQASRRQALTTLLNLDEDRLNDLGICRQDLLDAQNAPAASMGNALHRARADNAKI